MKIAVVTCSPQPDYVRARVLRAALQQLPDGEILVIKNHRRGLWRYIEVPGKIIRTKFREKPDLWLLTFRGYEMLPLLLLVSGKTPVIFDEMINATEWIVDEHRKVAKNSWAARLLNWWYGRQLRRCYKILADTAAHAAYSAKRSHVPAEKYVTIPVGTDETVFQPVKSAPAKHFQVFFYGSMLPLHGLSVVLEAAKQLKDIPEISFLLVGGGSKVTEQVTAAQQAGARVQYKSWIPFEALPQTVAKSGLCLAGPFGNTLQAQMVITGKAYQFLASAAPTVIGQNQTTSLFRDKQNCLLVPQANAKALAAAIQWAATHPTELRALAKAGRKLYEDKFSTTVISAALARALPLA